MGLEILFYIFGIIAVIAFAIGVILSRKLIKNQLTTIDYKVALKPILYAGIAFTLSFTLMSVGLFGFIKEQVKWYEYLLGIAGGLILSLSIYVFLNTFMIHYYRKNLPSGLDKWLYRAMLISIPVMMVFLFVFLDGYAAYFTYPLVNGFNFEHGFVSIKSTYQPNIAFYALCILAGAVFVYFLCDHKMYVQYGKHGLLESTFLVAFPAGILGARLFYVIGNWSLEFANQPFWKVFAIWEGGLTILGGAIMGIVIGVAWFMWRNKGYSIFVAVDIIVPTILLAQAIGRWGNFFNCEVHGIEVSRQYFEWLPTVIVNNLAYSSASGDAVAGNIYVPLFLIESALNVGGYFIIAELFGRKLRKYTELGDLAFGYIIWYGLVRALLEPLRDGNYNMGQDGYWSWIWSVCFIAIGMALIAVNHIVRYLIKKHFNPNEGKPNKNTPYIITLVIFGVIALSGLIAGIVMMSTSTLPTKLEFNQFTWGTFILIVAIGFALLSSVPTFLLIAENRK